MKVMEMQVSEHSNGSNNHHHSLSDNLAVEMHISRHIETSIRILLVDDYVILRQGICALLSEEDDFEIVGEAGTEKAALMLAMELQPDIVLLDSSLGASSGLDVAKQLLRTCTDTRVVLLTGSNDERLLFDALRVGIHGYLQKTLSIDD